MDIKVNQVSQAARPEAPQKVQETDDAFRFIQAVRALDLGDVQRFATQKGFSLVAGHMRPDHPGIRVPPDKISNGRFHQPLALAESSATFIMMAHSIRLRNNSQPAS